MSPTVTKHDRDSSVPVPEWGGYGCSLISPHLMSHSDLSTGESTLSSLMLSSGNGLNECQPSVHRMQETPLQSVNHIIKTLVSSVPILSRSATISAALSDFQFDLLQALKIDTQ